MAIAEERLQELAGQIAAELPARGNFNLLVVVAPPAEANTVGCRLAELMEAVTLDFDATALQLMEDQDWDQFLTYERGRFTGPVQRVLRATAATAHALVAPERPLVVRNANLPAGWGYDDLSNELYQVSVGGVIVLCVGGSMRDGLVWLHHSLPLAGAGLVNVVDLTA